jgi:formate hydrogenlyase subunit 3/multisubunit Na+/H+ antiporter MnhD subunit
VKTDALPALIVMLPLMAAIGAYALPRAARGIGTGILVLLVLLNGWLAATILNGGVQLHRVGGWIAPLGIHLRADGLAVLLLLAVSVVGLFVSIHALDYFGAAGEGKGAQQSKYFWPLWLFLVAALNAMFLSGDVFNLYVTMELSGLAAVALVALAGDRAAIGSALRYLFISLSGSLLYLMGVALLYGGYGTVDLALLAERMTAESYSSVALALMTGGLMMKAALFPMHFWLPPAHSSAPAPVSAVLSALVVKGGLYVLLRLWFEPFSDIATAGAAQLVGVLGAGAVLWGSLQALVQDRLKLLVAYSTVAQLGYLFLLFPLVMNSDSAGTIWTGGVMLLLSHATAKSAMFLSAGNIMRAAGHDRIDDLDGIIRVLPVSAFTIGMAGVSLVGLPPSAGFVGKWLLLAASLQQKQWWLVVVILAGSLLAAGYMIRLLAHAFIRVSGEKAPDKVSPGMQWSAFALALISMVLGFIATGPAGLLESALLKGVGP